MLIIQRTQHGYDEQRSRTVLVLPNGDEIIVTILRVRSDGQVRVGFSAPKDVKIVRAEIMPSTTKEPA